MPRPKALQPARRTPTSSTSRSQRTKCRLCHRLDPRGHVNSVYKTESNKEAVSALTLVIDSTTLSKTKSLLDRGCRFCDVLVQACDTFLHGWRDTAQRLVVDIQEKGTVKVSIDGEKWKGEVVEIYAGSASRAPWPTLGSAHHIPSTSGSDDTFDFARRCIQECLHNTKHGACNKKTSNHASSTPKRLLDVGRVGAPIRLIDTQGKSFHYSTLSHCWGTGPTLTVTKSSWPKLTTNISFQQLPALFQDAVIITRQLGLRYIWIDSLCIIQDSVRDWETESSKMADIYENSYVTIAATTSGDGSVRCLGDRRKAVKLNYQNTAGKEIALRARKIGDHHPDLATGEPAKPLGHLALRAWVLQEQVLSTRILHYTATELLFECKTSYRCECMPARKAYPSTPSLIPKALAKRGQNSSAIWDAWQHMVEQYTHRKLTVASDKLPAISGIASKIKDATCSTYLAGVWKDNLASDLLWSTWPTVAGCHAPETYRAPTFSWASLDTPIFYYHPEEEERALMTSTVTIKTSTVLLDGLNQLGAVSSAHIDLRAPCLEALLSSTHKDPIWEYKVLIKGTSAIRLAHDCLLVEVEVSSHGQEHVRTVHRAGPQEALVKFKTPVLCLGVATYGSWVSGLVLGLSHRIPGAWERLGTFSAGTEAFGEAEEREVQIV